MADIIQLRRDLASQWTEVNPILASGEMGFETDSVVDIDSVPKLKIGNAVTHWNDLPYLGAGGGGGGASYRAPMWKQADGDMTAGTNTFVETSLIGATQMNYIIVNKNNEYLGEDFTFNSGTGAITRTNNWQIGDILITPYKPA